MRDWRNPDLLVPPERRQRLEAETPGTLAVFDWPELRALFEQYDALANFDRARRRRRGAIAISVAAGGGVLAALLSFIEPWGTTILRVAAAFSAGLSAVGLAWAIGLKVTDSHKARWLEHRLRTERIRQFYFQTMLSDPALAVRRLTDETAEAAWRAHRTRALAVLDAWLQAPVAPEFRAVIDDVNQDLLWQCAAWRRSPPPPPEGPAAEAYFEVLRQQRIEVQLRYVSDKLAPGLGSPETQLQIVTIGSWLLTVAAVLVSIGSAAVLFDCPSTNSRPFRVLSCVIALIGIASIYLRVLAEGLGLRSDVERYGWYRRAVEKVAADFNHPAPEERLRALRNLEAASYREMQEFLLVHDRSSFIFS